MQTLRAQYCSFVAGDPVSSGARLPVLDKHSGATATEVLLAGPAEIERAIAAAARIAPEVARIPAFERQAVLDHVVGRIRERAEELARVLAIEAGKPIRDARGEVVRMVDTFRLAAEESTRIGGESLDLQISKRAAGYRGVVKRVPVGAVSLVTPFNFPLNLVAHKVAPAIAAGCPFVLKPSEKTPVSALILAEILAETSLPKESFSVVVCAVEHIAPLVEDDRLKLLSFTGSGPVGWALKARAGRKKVVLELGGNAAVIVDRDQRASIDRVVDRIALGAFYQSGQSCISVQRVLVDASLYGDVRDALVAAARAQVVGDPSDEATQVGPLVDEAAAKRVEAWISSAVTRGARVLSGGARRGSMIEPTVLEGVPEDEPAWAEEIFGPVVCLAETSSFDDALARVNASAYGLQAGVFTNDLSNALRAWDELEVGGVVVGDVPSFRVDSMPYGGVKGSGLGREGVRYAIEDMTEPRLLVLRG
ncbi:MAG: aldehyde dehydrogenase family protein [Polyangiaceae bacterium]